MKPTGITLTNVKGRDGHWPLSPVTVVTGGNRAGKSAILAGAKFALIGYDPSLGKQHNATFQLASERLPELGVTITHESGSFSRSIKKGKEDALKYSETGTPPEVPVILADMAGYFGLKTEQDRINYVFERIDPAALAFSDEDLLAKLGKIEAVPVVHAVKARDELIAAVQKTIVIRKRDKVTIQDWINQVLDQIKSNKKDANGVVKSTGQAMQPLKHAGPAPVSQQAELDAAKKDFLGVCTQVETLKSRKSDQEKTDRRISDIENLLAVPLQDTSELEKGIQTLSDATKSYSSHTLAQSGALERLRERAANLLSDKTVVLNDITTKEVFLKNNASCPYGCPGDHWKAMFHVELSKLREKLAQIDADRAKVVKDGKAMAEEVKKAKDADTAHAESLLKLKALQNDLAEKKSVSADARKDLEAEYKLLAAKERFVLAELETAITGQAIKEQLVAAEEKAHAAFASFQSNLDQFKKFEELILASTAKSEVLKLALDIIIEIQQTILGQAFDALLIKAKPFTDGLLPYSLTYNAVKCELGFQSDIGWVSHKTFSDSERALAYAGLSVALAQSSPFKVVFMDEMGKFEFEPVNMKEKVVARMSELVEAGIIHFFLGADNRTKDYLAMKFPHFSQIVLA